MASEEVGLANVVTSRSAASVERRKQMRLRILLGACAALFAAGVIVFLQSRGNSHGPAPTNATLQELRNQKSSGSNVKSGGTMTAEQHAVAVRFITTALGRVHLAEAWNMATPELRSGVTRKQWLAGEMPIPPFPVDRLKASGYQVVASSPTKLLLQVFLVPKPGTQYVATRYDMTLVRRGGKWLVSYLVPYAPQGIFSTGNS